jgi:hypothetical protein
MLMRQVFIVVACASLDQLHPRFRRAGRLDQQVPFSSFSLFEFFSLGTQVSDSHDHKMTIFLEAIVVVNMFSSLAPHALG